MSGRKDIKIAVAYMKPATAAMQDGREKRDPRILFFHYLLLFLLPCPFDPSKMAPRLWVNAWVSFYLGERIMCLMKGESAQ